MVKHTQTIRRLLQANCLSVFDRFVGLTLKKLKLNITVPAIKLEVLVTAWNKNDEQNS